MAKKTNNDEFFEEQIGNLGGEPQEPKLGEKLKHIPGQQDKLSESEDAELKAFINRADSQGTLGGNGVFSDSETTTEIRQMPRISEGWNPINRLEMGIRSQFYPEDWTFYIRPATVEAVKNWSAVEEERLEVVNAVFNDIIRTCVSIKSASGNIPWNRINSWDRFWFILKIREYTFKNGEAKVEFDDTCPECEEELHYVLKPESLFYEFPDPDIVDKHWNALERAWYINPRDYGVNAPEVKLYIPTIEKDQAILDWALQNARGNKKLDNVFLKYLPWMLAKVPKDTTVLEKFIKDAHNVYKSWNIEMFEFMEDVVRNITINPSENLKQVCPHCGEEVVSSVRFPNGIRALFKTQAKHAKFGSR